MLAGQFSHMTPMPMTAPLPADTDDLPAHQSVDVWRCRLGDDGQVDQQASAAVFQAAAGESGAGLP